MKHFRIIFSALSIFAALQVLSAPATAEPASQAQIRQAKQLTANQKRKAVELLSKPGHKAMAVSRSGPWGYRYGVATRDMAVQGALENCNAHVRKGKYLCEIILVNNDLDLAPLDSPRRATQAYRMYDAKSAVEFFGIRSGSYTGNFELAKRNFAQIKEQGSLSSIKKDKKLQRLLTGTSVIWNRKQVLLFSPAGFASIYKAQSGDLASYALSWKALEGGLVCTENERWATTGKPIGTRCFIIHAIDNGKARVSWAESNSTSTRVVVEGDASIGRAR